MTKPLRLTVKVEHVRTLGQPIYCKAACYCVLRVFLVLLMLQNSALCITFLKKEPLEGK